MDWKKTVLISALTLAGLITLIWIVVANYNVPGEDQLANLGSSSIQPAQAQGSADEPNKKPAAPTPPADLDADDEPAAPAQPAPQVKGEDLLSKTDRLATSACSGDDREKFWLIGWSDHKGWIVARFCNQQLREAPAEEMASVLAALEITDLSHAGWQEWSSDNKDDDIFHRYSKKFTSLLSLNGQREYLLQNPVVKFVGEGDFKDFCKKFRRGLIKVEDNDTAQSLKVLCSLKSSGGSGLGGYTGGGGQGHPPVDNSRPPKKKSKGDNKNDVPRKRYVNPAPAIDAQRPKS